jgi:DNA invertase Pin-like site-specific DNA recombinase
MSIAAQFESKSVRFHIDASRTERARRLQPSLDREYIVPVILKTVRILDLLGSQPGGLRSEQIHQQTAIAKTTVYRILRTLVVSGHLKHGANGACSIAAPTTLTGLPDR